MSVKIYYHPPPPPNKKEQKNPMLKPLKHSPYMTVIRGGVLFFLPMNILLY